MSLEDFFTLSELKDGLTAPDRVRELLTVMEREKDSVVNNFGEATRQWSTVANTIAITENNCCLELFINLNGLNFIDKWLKDAQKLGNDTGDNFSEKSIIASLRALERLPIDNQMLSSSGVGTTVWNLVAHGSLVVGKKAKSLCDRWMLVQDLDAAPQDVQNLGALGEDNDKKDVERPGDETMQLSAPPADTIQEVIVNNEETTTPDKIMDTATTNHVHEGGSVVVKDEEKEEIHCRDKVEMSTVSSPVEKIASSTDVDNALETSSIKTDLQADRDEVDMVDDDESSDRNQAGASADALPDSLTEGPKMSESDREAGNGKEHGGVESSENDSHLFKLSMSARGDGGRGKASDMEPNYGMIDPLEVARQVANEVEREVDSRERSCSTSEKISGGGSDGPNRPGSKSAKEGLPAVTSGPESSPKHSPMKDASSKADITVSQISEVAQESANTGRGMSGIDLNQEVCSEEVDNPINPVSSTISVVSASRAAAAAGLPASPLQFEGTLGWKGSASTSAFRRIPEGDNVLSSSHNFTEQRVDCLDFDLNVAEGSEDKIDDFVSRNKMPLPILSGGEESSVEASPRGAGLQLDLNSIVDSGADAVIFGWRQAQSPSRSSSSSSKQPSLRNFDLNLSHQPVFPSGGSLDHPYLHQLPNQFGGSRGEESVISIFGTAVDVKNTDSLAQPSGRMMGPTVDFRPSPSLVLESSLQYMNPPLYGHHHGAAMFYPTPMYGSPGMHIPYMPDPRVVPQIMGSSSAPSPYMMNMGVAGSSSGSSGAHNFDLNAGSMTDVGNREAIGGLRQLYQHNGRSMDEREQSSSSRGKRSEPDGGWDFFGMSKQQQPWR